MRNSTRILVALGLMVGGGCRISAPTTPTAVAICSQEAPDICWSEAKAADDRASAEAAAKFEIACQAEGFKHRALACTWAGLGLQGEPDEKPRAMAMHETACEAGIQTSCAQLASLLMHDTFSEEKEADREKLYERIRSLSEPVCNSDPLAGEAKEFGTDPRADACSTLAPVYEQGFGVPKDEKRALTIWSRACDLGSSQGCARMGFFYERGLGVEQDLGAAVQRYQTACDDGAAMGCANLASMYTQGSGVDRDYAKAVELYDRACERKYLDSCTRSQLARVLDETEGDMQKRVDEVIVHLDEEAAEIEAKLGEGDVSDKAWVKKKLKTMFDVDQLYRRAFEYRQHFDEEHAEAFQKELGERIWKVDENHLADFKQIVEEWGWITRSEFDPMASDQAWLIVQHADRDPAFQAEILERLEPLADDEEIDPAHYAYLYDRVAVHHDRKQRYGTQGRCVDGTWQPRSMEEPEKVDERRASVGLEPMAEYRKMFENVCP